MNAFEIEALMDEEIETYEQESEVPAGSGDGGRLAAGVRYRRGGDGVVHARLRPIGRLRNWAR